MKLRLPKHLTRSLFVAFVLVGCGSKINRDTLTGSSGNGEENTGDSHPEDAPIPRHEDDHSPTSEENKNAYENKSQGNKTADGGVLSSTNGISTTASVDESVMGSTIRLLRPSELDKKSQSVFGLPWMVANSGQMTNGFDLYSANLNGIDYNTNNSYSTVVSPIYISTQQNFCNDLANQALADNTAKAKFLTDMKLTDTLATNRAGIEKTIISAMNQMFGENFEKNNPLVQLSIKLYGFLEGQTPQNRNNVSPLGLTLAAVCFTDMYVYVHQ